MAQYRAIIQGSRNSVSRLGHKSSGIQAEANGWNIGAKIAIWYDEKTGKDRVRVYKTGGSHRATSSEIIAEFSN